ncbi:MAG: GlmU family protein, partial [bacterium]
MIVIFEDEYFKKLLPLTYMRPVYELRCGMKTLLGKIIGLYPKENISLHMRSYLAATRKKIHPYAINSLKEEDTLFLNGRILADQKTKISISGDEELLIHGEDEVAAFRVKKENIKKITTIINNVFSQKALEAAGIPFRKHNISNINLIKYPWQLVHKNSKEIISDFANIKAGMHGKIYQDVNLLNKKNIHIGRSSKILPGVTINAEDGPVFIGDDVEVMENAVLRGPVSIGNGSKIKVGAKIYEGTSIGPVCKIGGEVEGSIFHGYSNKQHDGFIGHSYISEWVNLGAGTDNSDLKNNYGHVKVYIDGKLVDSGETFVGLTMGDHTKCGIGTTFNTGSVIGVSCNLYGSGFHSKEIPSFTWGSPQNYVEYDPKKALEVAKRVLGRRKIEMSKEEEQLFMYVYQLTSLERDRGNIKKGTIDI